MSAPKADYALLLLPSASRVYAASAVQLAISELSVFGRAFDAQLSDVRIEDIAGIPYVCFTAEVLPQELVSNLSSAYALFAREGDALRPVRLSPRTEFASDLLTIQKYPGKTNEQFTHLLFNVTVLSTSRPESVLDGKLRVLDPVCGRGTTLNRALMYGADCAGIDIDSKDVDAYAQFISTWVKTHRLPHKVSYGPVRRNKQVVAKRLSLQLYADRQAQKESRGIDLDVVAADTLKTPEYFQRGSFDVVVGDLPYGVAHGSRQGGELSRRPGDLLAKALPVWASMLRPGGAIGLSFNRKVQPRAQLEQLIADSDLKLVELPDFVHRVDASIQRDLIVARRS